MEVESKDACAAPWGRPRCAILQDKVQINVECCTGGNSIRQIAWIKRKIDILTAPQNPHHSCPPAGRSNEHFLQKCRVESRNSDDAEFLHLAQMNSQFKWGIPQGSHCRTKIKKFHGFIEQNLPNNPKIGPINLSRIDSGQSCVPQVNAHHHNPS